MDENVIPTADITPAPPCEQDFTARYEEELAALRAENSELKDRLAAAVSSVSTGVKTCKPPHCPDNMLRRAFGLKDRS